MSILTVIDDLCQIINSEKNIYEITMKGEKTNIVIRKGDSVIKTNVEIKELDLNTDKKDIHEK